MGQRSELGHSDWPDQPHRMGPSNPPRQPDWRGQHGHCDLLDHLNMFNAPNQLNWHAQLNPSNRANRPNQSGECSQLPWAD